MRGEHDPGDKEGRATASDATAGVTAPVAEGIIGKGVSVFLSLKLMAGRRVRGDGNREVAAYGQTFEEEHSCKQPLLVKVWLV